MIAKLIGQAITTNLETFSSETDFMSFNQSLTLLGLGSKQSYALITLALQHHSMSYVKRLSSFEVER